MDKNDRLGSFRQTGGLSSCPSIGLVFLHELRSAPCARRARPVRVRPEQNASEVTNFWHVVSGCVRPNSRRAVAITARPNLKISQRSCGVLFGDRSRQQRGHLPTLGNLRNYWILLVLPTGRSGSHRVSTIILRPIRPQSPSGSLFTNFPGPLMGAGIILRGRGALRRCA
jgi:hypothetical protein